jgi:hypothetical protein
MKKYQFLIVALLCLIKSFGQDRMWSGIVLDCSQQPIEGVQVKLNSDKAQINSTSSNSRGEYSFIIPPSVSPGTEIHIIITTSGYQYCTEEEKETGKYVVIPTGFWNRTIPNLLIKKPVDGRGVSITSPNFRGMNYLTWCDSSIKRDWRLNRGSSSDQPFTIKGTVTKPPAGGYVTLSVIVDKEYTQPGRFFINNDGTWCGKLYLSTSDGTSIDKSIVIYVNNSAGEKINECEFFIRSCH